MTKDENIIASIDKAVKVIVGTDNHERFELLMDYANAVIEWNKVHNIISRNTENIFENIYDSIFAASLFDVYFSENSQTKRIVDIGSGNGLPGIPLAILFPKKDIVLVDSNRKKCSFLRATKSELKLQNVSILNKNFDNSFQENFIITKAAFSPTNSGVLISGLKKGGKAILWATPKIKEELVSEMAKVSAQLIDEKMFILPTGKERLFLVFEKL